MSEPEAPIEDHQRSILQIPPPRVPPAGDLSVNVLSPLDNEPAVEVAVLATAGSGNRHFGSRRSRAIVGIGAALVLVAGVAFAVTRGRSDPQSADSAATDSPLRLVLDDPPHGLVLASVSDHAPGVTGDTYQARLHLRTAPFSTAVIQARRSSSELPEGYSTTVHGVPAVFIEVGQFNLRWNQDGVAYRIEFDGPKATNRAFVLDLADRVQPGGSAADPAAPPLFTLASVPDGFDLTVAGAGYEMAFRPEGNDARSAQPTLRVNVRVGGPSAADYALFLGGSRAATVRGTTGYIRTETVGGTLFVRIIFDVRENVQIILLGESLTRAEVMQVAEGLRIVSEGAWVKAMGHLLDAAPMPTTAATGSVPTSSTG